MTKKQIETKNAPSAIGPYSQAITVNNFVFISGQIPLDPKTNELVSGDIKTQTRQIFNNIGEILKQTNASYENIIKVTVFLTDLSHFSEVNEIFKEFLSTPFPARSTVQVVGLPKNAQVEIEVIAMNPSLENQVY